MDIKIIYDQEGKAVELFILIDGILYPLPWQDNIFDWDSIEYEPTRSSLQSAWETWIIDKDIDYELRNRSDLASTSLYTQPDWDNLRDRLLGGDLYSIYSRVRENSFATSSLDVITANNISTALGMITDSIITVKTEQTLASSLHLLTSIAGYTLTDEEKILWNTVIEELGFTDLVKIN